MAHPGVIEDHAGVTMAHPEDVKTHSGVVDLPGVADAHFLYLYFQNFADLQTAIQHNNI
jgi:hypothetical protein